MIRLLVVFLAFVHFPSLGQWIGEGEIVVDGVAFDRIEDAQKRIVDGSTIYLGPGVYSHGIQINKDNVVLSGSKGTHFVNAAIKGKAAIITSGNNITIEDIECSNIKVSSGNGACIRHEGKNLTVKGVYFHDSQEGILEAKNEGRLVIMYSRFERLGYNGRTHGVYTNGAELLIKDSSFISMVGQGHSVKSRSRKTVIQDTLISTQKGQDSRLIDISNGGELVVSNSILHQSNNTVNRQLIGYGLEKIGVERSNRVVIKDNLIIMERKRGNEFLALPKGRDSRTQFDITTDVYDNVLVGRHIDDVWSSHNTYYENRKDAGLAEDQLPTILALPNVLTFLSK